MPLDVTKSKIGSKRTAHIFAGQSEGEQLVKWLNDEEAPRIGASRQELHGEARTRKQISRLISDLNESAETFLAEGKSNPALNERIDSEFARHSLRVKALHPQDTGKHKTFAAPKWMFGWYSNTGSRVAEMIFAIVRLGERGLIARVRICAKCNRWFYAKFNHQRFCTNRCQLLHYQTSEEWKARRRERYRERNL